MVTISIEPEDKKRQCGVSEFVEMNLVKINSTENVFRLQLCVHTALFPHRIFKVKCPVTVDFFHKSKHFLQSKWSRAVCCSCFFVHVFGFVWKSLNVLLKYTRSVFSFSEMNSSVNLDQLVTLKSGVDKHGDLPGSELTSSSPSSPLDWQVDVMI